MLGGHRKFWEKISAKKYYSIREASTVVSIWNINYSKHGNKNTGIASIKIPLNIVCRYYYLDSYCI